MNNTYSLQDIQLAYRKLKCYFYYDNTSLHIREALAKFENTEDSVYAKPNIDDKFKALLKIMNTKKPIITKGFKSLLEQIDVLVLPKSYKSKKLNNKDEFILTNRIPSLPFELDRINYFIDAPIEIHIISVMWIMKEGFYLQKKYEKNNFAYKIALDENDEINLGLKLFEKYFAQYQSWRDRSINAAKDLLDKEQEAIVVQMDIKNYFHNVQLDFSKIREQIPLNEDTESHKLTNLLECIYANYCKKLGEKSDFGDNSETPPLPIGLLSSGVISNWYLKEFDDEVIEKLTQHFIADMLMILLLFYQIYVWKNKMRKNPPLINLLKNILLKIRF